MRETQTLLLGLSSSEHASPSPFCSNPPPNLVGPSDPWLVSHLSRRPYDLVPGYILKSLLHSASRGFLEAGQWWESASKWPTFSPQGLFWKVTPSPCLPQPPFKASPPPSTHSCYELTEGNHKTRIRASLSEEARGKRVVRNKAPAWHAPWAQVESAGASGFEATKSATLPWNPLSWSLSLGTLNGMLGSPSSLHPF